MQVALSLSVVLDTLAGNKPIIRFSSIIIYVPQYILYSANYSTDLLDIPKIMQNIFADYTFALRGILCTITEDVDLMHSSIGLKKLFKFRFWPGAWNLSHKHLDGVRVWLVQMLQRPIHLAAVAKRNKQKGICS